MEAKRSCSILYWGKNQMKENIDMILQVFIFTDKFTYIIVGPQTNTFWGNSKNTGKVSVFVEEIRENDIIS